MTEFLRLPPEDQREIILTIAMELGHSPQVLHKDVWVCWALQKLFDMESEVRMAFKGGTSLSKVFQAIHRFSEDVDISLDYRDLTDDQALDVFSPETTNSSRKRFCKKLSATARDHVHRNVFPSLTDSFTEITDGNGKTEVSENGEKLWLHYPALTNSVTSYLGDWILVEFGGRNVTEPNGPHAIAPTVAERLPSLQFPIANVTVLAPERTFWEKATLIHVECHRQRSISPNRISRHWYDLAMLSRGAIGKKALSDRSLLQDVVRHKSVFFDASYANYQDCLSGSFRLIPTEPLLSSLKNDYKSMQDAGMFDGEVPLFEELLKELRTIEVAMNA